MVIGKSLCHILRASIIIGVAIFSVEASALPSFTRQTGEACVSCHIGSYGPQLTPRGMLFKLTGYTQSDGEDGKVPLSAMIVEGFTHTSKK